NHNPKVGGSSPSPATIKPLKFNSKYWHVSLLGANRGFGEAKGKQHATFQASHRNMLRFCSVKGAARPRGRVANMVRRVFAAAILMLSVASWPMTVMGQQPPLTDNSVKASYCLGYFFAQDAEAKRQFSSVCHGDPAAVVACIRQQFRSAPAPIDKVLRVMPYVRATGGADSGLEAQGMQDYQKCFAELQRQSVQACFAKSAKPCFDELPPLKKDGLPLSEAAAQYRANMQMRCMADRCESQMCVKAQTCESMDFLPY
ncbi:MAG TPA: hypothetical protein VJR47_09975, partial [Stellaceae bacterium]|nr:hypothetical protein [Stellaceae bacterium]